MSVCLPVLDNLECQCFIDCCLIVILCFILTRVDQYIMSLHNISVKLSVNVCLLKFLLYDLYYIFHLIDKYLNH